MSDSGTARWETQREHASPFWLRLLFWIALHLGRPAARLFLYPTAVYFWLRAPVVTRASRDYLRRVLQREPGALDVLRHIFCFAAVSLDRIFILSGRHQDFEVAHDRPAEVSAIINRGQGCLLFVSHLGGYDSLRLMGREKFHLPLKILMDRQHGRMLMQLFDALNLSMASLVIDSDQPGPALALEIKQALESGHLVCMNADRFRGEEKTVVVNFLGNPARLPVSPWLLAHTLRVPVILGFGLYLGGRRYQNRLELFAERVLIPRERREAAAQECVLQYAERLAHHAKSAPYNWFNFYDYWLRG